MNLNALRTLSEVEQVGSFAAAADRLGLTLSAISTQLKKLEQELNVSLFDRSFRPPLMTPEGRRIARHAHAILTEAQEIRSIGKPDDALTGNYRIGFIPTAMVRLMPHFLIASARHCPRATFAVESGLSADLAQRVLQGDLDAALLTETPGDEMELDFHALFTERFVLTVPKHARNWNLRRCAKELIHVRLVRPASGIHRLVSDKFDSLRIECRTTQLLDSVEAAVECVNAGIAFSILPEPDVRRYATGAIARRIPEIDFSRRIGLATRKDSAMRNSVQALAKLFPGKLD